MLLSLVLTLALKLWTPPTPVEKGWWGSHHWVLDTKRDRFTGVIACRLLRDHMSYEGDAVVFRFAPDVDTSQAFYKVDRGPAQSVAAEALKPPYVGLGADSGDVANPSGGLVRIPFSRLRGARLVFIETHRYSLPTRFKIDGLEAAIHASAGAGCGPRSWVARRPEVD